MQTLIIGDVHGCLAELRALLKKTAFEPHRDRLIFVGDLVDRGPDSADTVAFVRNLAATADIVCLMGNHEDKYVRFHRKVREGGMDQARRGMPAFGPEKIEIYRRLSDEDLAWLEQLPFHHRGDGFLVVHAGVCPRRHRDWPDLDKPKYRDRLLRLRDVDPDGKFLGLHHDCPDARPWFNACDGRFGHVFFGHQPRDEVVESPHATGLDTSCAFGGRLTACVFAGEDWPNRRYVSVPAEGKFAERFEEE